jgi:hypothetical protein
MTITFTEEDLRNPETRARLLAIVGSAPAAVVPESSVPAPARRKSPRGPTRVVPPTADELAEVSDVDRARLVAMAERKGMLKP